MKIFDVKLNKEATLSGDNNDNIYNKYSNFKYGAPSNNLFTDELFEGRISNSVSGGTIYSPLLNDIVDDGSSSEVMISPLMYAGNNYFVKNLRISFLEEEDNSKIQIKYYLKSPSSGRESEITYTSTSELLNLYDSPADVVKGSIKIHRFLQYSTTLDYIFIISFATVKDGKRSIGMLYVVFTNETCLYTQIKKTYPSSLTSSPIPLNYLNIYDYWIVNNSTTITTYIVPKCNFGYKFTTYYKISQTIGNKDTGALWTAPEYTSLSLHGIYNLQQINNISIHSKFHDENNFYIMNGDEYDYTWFDSIIGGTSNTKEATQTGILSNIVYVVSSAQLKSYTNKQIYLMKLSINITEISIVESIYIKSITQEMINNLGYTMSIYKYKGRITIYTYNGLNLLSFNITKNSSYTNANIYNEYTIDMPKLSLTPILCSNAFRYQIFNIVFDPSYDPSFKTNTKWVSADGRYYTKLKMKVVNSINSPHLYIYTLRDDELLFEIIPHPSYVIASNNLPSYNSIYKVINSELIFNYFVRMNGVNFNPLTDSSRNFNHFLKTLNHLSSNYYCISYMSEIDHIEFPLSGDFITVCDAHGNISESQRFIKFIPSKNNNQSLYYNTSGTSYTKIIENNSIANVETTIYFNSCINSKQITQYKLDEVPGGQFNTLQEGSFITTPLNNYNVDIIECIGFIFICEQNKVHVCSSLPDIQHLYTIVTNMVNPSKQIKLTQSVVLIKDYTQNEYYIGIGDNNRISTNKNIKTIYTKDGITHISETPLELNNNTYNSVDADVIHYASVQIEGKTVVFFGSKHDSI